MAAPEPATPDPVVIMATNNDGVLPSDALYEILLRVPVKPLCRLRAVCRAWRSLLSDPHFVASHGARRPLIAVGKLVRIDDDDGHPLKLREVTFLDAISGDVVKRARLPRRPVQWDRTWSRMLVTHADIVCLVDRDLRLSVLDPTTAAVSPPATAPVVKYAEESPTTRNFVGRVPSTGEHKVVRISHTYVVVDGTYREKQLVDVLTLSSGSVVGGGYNCSSWREVRGAPGKLSWYWRREVAVVNGAVYFLLPPAKNRRLDGPDWLAALDLETEQWRPAGPFQGPITAGDSSAPASSCRVTLAELQGRLVVVCDTPGESMELWSLTAPAPAASSPRRWWKQYTIRMSCHLRPAVYVSAEPLWVLADGRIVFWQWPGVLSMRGGVLQLYDPSNGTLSTVTKMIDDCVDVRVYTGNLLLARCS